MRITRSGLRRIIAEESARILAEAKQYKGSREPHRDGDGDDVQAAIDILNDTGEDPFPFGKKDSHERIPGGHQMRMAAGFEDEPEEEDWEDVDKTDEEWAEEQLQGVMDMYGHPDPFGDDEALEKGYEYDGAGGWKKPGLKEGEGKGHHTSPRQRLAAYLKSVGADVGAIMAAVDAAVSRGNDEGLEVSADDIAFGVSNDVLEAIPEEDTGRWWSMLDAVIADEVDLDAFADAEAYRKDIKDTERDLSHPSNFLEEGDDDIQGDAEDPYADTESSYRKHKAFWGGEPGSSLKASHSDFDDVRGSAGGVPRFVSGGAKGRPARIRGADIDSGYDDEVTDDSLTEARWAKLAGILEG